MHSSLRCAVISIALFHVAMGQSNVAFDAATASSTHAGVAFTAGQAISAGSGYWCSSGNHVPGQIVAWTGTTNARHKVIGITINWAYGPGEFKVLTSSDGGNFEEAACWRAATRTGASYEESIMFDTAQNVKALTILMRSPMPWSYFGINSAALIVEPYPFMFVNGASSAAGEQCVIAKGSSIASSSCLDALAAGDGQELFTFDKDQIVNLASKECVTLANGDSLGGGRLVMATCMEASDGRSLFEVTSDGQLKMKNMGNLCVQITEARAFVQDCSEGGDKYSLVAVPEFDPTVATSAVSAASLLNRAAERQRSLFAKLQAALPTLEACKFSAALAHNSSQMKPPMSLLDVSHTSASEGASDPATDAISRIYAMLDVNAAGLKTLIAESIVALNKIARAA